MKNHIKQLRKVGGYSFLVLLPKEWVQKQGFNESSRVLLREANDGSLVVTKEEVKA